MDGYYFEDCFRTKAVVVLGETLHVDDAVDDYNDALGNSKRRMLNFVDTHAEPLRSLYVGVRAGPFYEYRVYFS